MRYVSGAGISAAAITLGAFAFSAEGMPTANVELHDGGVWITNESVLMVGHLNQESQILDSGLRTTSNAYDIYQEGFTVLVHDEANNVLSVVNPASVASDADVALPRSSRVDLGGEVVAITGGEDGAVWVMPVKWVGTFEPDSVTPVVTLGRETEVAVGDDGVAYAHSAETGKYAEIALDPSGRPSVRAEGTLDTDATDHVVLAAVGTQRVTWDTDNGVLYSSDRSDEFPVDSAVQQTSQAHGGVAIATPDSLVFVPADGSEPVVKPAGAKGDPAAPVYLNGCTYAAWAGSGIFVRDCVDDVDDRTIEIDGAVSSSAFVFRVNRDVVVLNDYVNGHGWVVGDGLERVDNWADLLPPPEKEQEEESFDDEERLDALPPRTEENTPPVAEDDAFGARAGRTTVIPVIDNDYDLDGDVLTATVVDSKGLPGEAQLIRGGAALQVVLPDAASGTATLTYRASDGRGGVDDAEVTITIVGKDANSSPEPRRKSSMALEVGATASYNVLPDWMDPEGDTLVLKDVLDNGVDVVSFSPNGVITVTANPDVQGAREIGFVVSDGRAETQGKLIISVKPADTLPPLTNADQVVTVVDRPVVVSPLGNDMSRSGRPLGLASAKGEAGTIVTPNYVDGTFTFSSTRAGTFYVQYLAKDGPLTSANIVRIDVLAEVESSLPPVAVADVGLVAPGDDVLIDVLANDSDPAGGVLVVQDVIVPAGSGLTVAVLEHRLVRVTNVGGITDPVTLTYRVSNGSLTSESEITVMPIDAPENFVAPVAHDDEVVVRVGDIATVAVLANDEHPSGGTFSLAGLAEPGVDPVMADVFVAEDFVRIKAGETPGQVLATYTIVDEFGQRDAATLTIKIVGLDQANTAPRPTDVTARALGGSAVRIQIPLDGIDPDGDSVELVGVDGAPALGRIVQVGQDWFVYEAGVDSQGTDRFTYVVRDRLGAEASASVIVGVAPPAFTNHAPVAVQDVASVLPTRAVSVPVMVNDSDPDADLIALEPGGLVVPEGIEASVVADRILVRAADEGTFTIKYTITDVYGSHATSSLVVVVDPETPPAAPIARDDRVAAADISEDGTVLVNVLENDEDPDGVRADLAVGLDPLLGTVNADRSVTLVAGALAQVISYSVTDVDDQTATAFILVPGVGTRGPALVSEAPVEVVSGELEQISLDDYVVTATGNPAIITQAERVYAAHGDGSPLVFDERTLEYRSAAGYVGKDAITFQVTDGASVDDPLGTMATLTLVLDVIPAGNVAPTFRNTSIEVQAGRTEATTVDLTKLVADANPGDVDTLTFDMDGELPDGFTAEIEEGVLSIKVNAAVRGDIVEDVGVVVSDGTADPVPGVIRVTVLPARVDANGDVTETAADEAGEAVPAERIVANDDKVDDAKAGVVSEVQPLANDSNPYPKDKPLELIDARVESGNAEVTLDGDKVLVTPANDFAGVLVVRYTVGDASLDPKRQTSARIILTVVKAPDAPSKPVAKVVEDSRVVLEWVEPSNNGAPITSFTVTSDQGTSTTCATSICAIEDLENNTEYRFTVVAHNEAGKSEPSPASDPARPDIHPDQPSAPILTFGDESLNITWATPTSKGSPVRSYTLEISPAPPTGPEVSNLTGNSYVWTGLENGVAYQVRIQAYNDAVEPSTWSTYSANEIPAGPPFPVDKPTTTRLEPVGNRAQIAVNWTIPDGNGDNVSSFIINALRGGSVVGTQTVSGSTTSVPFELDPSSSDYTFRVVATNKAGTSTPSVPSDPRRAFVAPGAPTGVSIVPGDRAVTVSFTPGPANGADASWISYEYQLNGAGAWIAMPGGGVITGLSNGTAYSVRLRATTTADGATYQGAVSSASASAVPFGPIGAPSVSAARGSGAVTFTVTAPATNGRPITLIEYRTRSGSGAWSGWVNSGFTSGTHGIPVNVGGPSITAYIEVRVTAQDTPATSYASAAASSKDRVVWVSKGSSAASEGCSGCNYLVFNWQELPVGATYTVRCYDSKPTDGRLGSYDHSVYVGSTNGSDQLGCYYGYPGWQVWLTTQTGPGAGFSTPRYTW